MEIRQKMHLTTSSQLSKCAFLTQAKISHLYLMTIIQLFLSTIKLVVTKEWVVLTTVSNLCKKQSSPQIKRFNQSMIRLTYHLLKGRYHNNKPPWALALLHLSMLIMKQSWATYCINIVTNANFTCKCVQCSRK